MVAHFDYYYNKGDTASGKGVVWIPRTNLGNAVMNSTNTTSNGYKGSSMVSSTIPSVVTKLQSVLSTYLVKNRILLTNSMGTSLSSMAGAGVTGASNGWEWVDTYAVLPNEVQIFGTTILSSSFYDVGSDDEKLAVFNFINPTEFARSNFWLRSVASSTNFVNCNNNGNANNNNASNSNGVRPIILNPSMLMESEG